MDVDVWQACLGSTHGQCWLVIGSARSEVGVLGSKGTEERPVRVLILVCFFFLSWDHWHVAD